jgi:hypothetical protein
MRKDHPETKIIEGGVITSIPVEYYVKCDICDNIYPELRFLRKHVREDHPAEEEGSYDDDNDDELRKASVPSYAAPIRSRPTQRREGREEEGEELLVQSSILARQPGEFNLEESAISREIFIVLPPTPPLTLPLASESND